ncbi:MAG TPA: hypothetical protein VFI03_02005 [Solirubrobacterales bacterium]|nr:hypothetical protein [Solirubrobacterales bacterium]
MRRALVLAGVIFAGLLVAVSALAAGAGREVERELAFGLDAEGFTVRVLVSNNDGDVNATMILNRGPQVAYYATPATVTAERVTARFGSLGELDYRFTPKRNGSVDCNGSEEGEAAFEGTFDFTGENGYVHIEAGHAEGSFQVYPEPKNCPQKRLARLAVPYHPSYSDEGATLQARAGSRARGRIREVSVFDDGQRGRHRVAVFATLGEVREGMAVARGVQLAAGSGAFRWNLEKGTATLRPPAPFTGSATFTRHGHDGHGTWKGSLGMPILGGEAVKLAGGEFRAFIHKGVPQDE